VVVAKILLKRGLEINREGFIPSLGEPLLSIDEHRFYIGDGYTPGGSIPVYFLDDLQDVFLDFSYNKVRFDHWSYDSSARYFLGFDSSNFLWKNYLIIENDLPYHINVKRLADGSITNKEFQYLKDTTNYIQYQLNYKASIYGTPNYYFQIENKNFGPLIKNSIYTEFVDTTGSAILGNFPKVVDSYNPLIEVRNYLDNDYGSLRLKSLIVDGTIGFVNIHNLDYWDTWIYLSRDTTGIPLVDCGIRVVRGVESDARLYWDESNNIWKIGTIGNEYEIVNTYKSQILYNKTLFTPILISPTINDYTLAQHNHTIPSQGGQLTDDALKIPVRPNKGGTGKNTSNWTGFAKISYGDWYAGSIFPSELPYHTYLHKHDDLSDINPNQHHFRLHDVNNDLDHYGVLEYNKGGTGFNTFDPGELLIGDNFGGLTKGFLLSSNPNITIDFDGTDIYLSSYAGYDTIKDDFQTYPKKTILKISGPGLIVSDDGLNTKLRLSDDLINISNLNNIDGLLVRRYNTVQQKYEIIGREIETPLLISPSDTYLDVFNSKGINSNPKLLIGQRLVTTDTSQDISGIKIITRPILLSPRIISFARSTHTHETDYQGGKITEKSIKPSVINNNGKLLVVHDDNNVQLYSLSYRSNSNENLILSFEQDKINREIDIIPSWQGVLNINRGGTGANNRNSALNNLLPPQANNSGKFLSTDGIDAHWDTRLGLLSINGVGCTDQFLVVDTTSLPFLEIVSDTSSC